MIIPQLLDLSTTVSKLLIYFNINHVNDAPARQPSTPSKPPPFHPSLPLSVDSRATSTPVERAGRDHPGQTGNEHFDQDRSSQLPTIAARPATASVATRARDAFNFANEPRNLNPLCLYLHIGSSPARSVPVWVAGRFLPGYLRSCFSC